MVLPKRNISRRSASFRELENILERVPEVELVAITLDMPEVRRADGIFERKERMRGAEDRLFFVHVDGGEGGVAGA